MQCYDIAMKRTDAERVHTSGTVVINKRQRQSHRDSIKVGNLLTQLHKNAMGLLTVKRKVEDPSAPNYGEYEEKPYTMLSSQVKAAQILLDKAMPTLQAIDANIRSEEPTASPEELQHQLGMIIRALPDDELERLRKGDPALSVIDGEVVG